MDRARAAAVGDPAAAAATARAPLDAHSVRRIGVFRALMLGDLLCAVPALRALKLGFPQASITLIGLPWARTLVERLPQLDDFIAFPGHPAWPEQPADLAAWPGFLSQVQSRRFDLVLQLHGSGGIANPLVACFGARRAGGFYVPGAYCPDADLYVPWPDSGHEIDRLLRVVDRLGVARQGRGLEFPVQEADRCALERVWPASRRCAGEYVCLHAGAQLRSRRWPVARFAAVADHLAQQGCPVVLTGTPAEAGLARELQAAMRHRAVDLVGRTTLWELGALIEGARLVVSNDTGVSHIAAALHRPSVVISSGGDVARWGPLDRGLHRVLWCDLPCRPCSHELCPSGHECALAISTEAVIDAAQLCLTGEIEHVPQ
ncbi:glycosyltransferase family 9 protein [Caldimonas brevitalea]|uniref:ADP-heptose--lipooligosaccharide heptosyltransferase II n=1 Tax=Caldimonas brevitalea TaxID=413882 RepID=A0A0G3BVP5_9BURK|nr:glycosyltransferase family 9 protein [Caldimonas brevitalea]AKJ30600.1 ADP-heptose--lipooligosaccharide heptosyltransferase II [Caldimonas brevitalea]